MNDTRLVYSTDNGRICPECGRPQSKCVCQKGRSRADASGPGDGSLRIKREVKGRKGKTVTVISGFQENDAELKKIASQLKTRCGTGGSAQDGVIVIQGDHREALWEELTRQGFQVKLTGG
jgi:translation initiation factor 1